MNIPEENRVFCIKKAALIPYAGLRNAIIIDSEIVENIMEKGYSFRFTNIDGHLVGYYEKPLTKWEQSKRDKHMMGKGGE